MDLRKKLFAVSDIHGHCTLLKEALDRAGFDPENNEHLLVCCGDYFDRGTENYQVLKYLDRIENKVMIRGNHEDMLLKIFENGRLETHNYINGTVHTITDFFGKYALDAMGGIDFDGKSRDLDRITAFINETVNYFETEKYVFVHGWLPTVIEDGTAKADPDWRNASAEKWVKARWTKWIDVFESCVIPDKTIVCGHLPTFYARWFNEAWDGGRADIIYGKGFIALDAGTVDSGQINVLVIEDEKIKI